MPWEFFRSQPMSYCQLLIPPEAAYSCIVALGNLGKVQFVDLKADVGNQRRYLSEISRLEAMEDKLAYLYKEIRLRTHITPKEWQQHELTAPEEAELMDLEIILDRMESDIRQSGENIEVMQHRYFDLVERDYILEYTEKFCSEAEDYLKSSALNQQQSDLSVGSQLSSVYESNSAMELKQFARSSTRPEEEMKDVLEDEQVVLAVKIKMIAGVILRSKVPAFQRILWRVCPTGIMVQTAPIDFDLFDPEADEWSTSYVTQSMFVIFFYSDQIYAKVKKICESFGTFLVDIPETPEERFSQLKAVRLTVQEYIDIIHQSFESRYEQLEYVAYYVELWIARVHMLKGIFTVLNMLNFDVSRHVLIAECWVPTKNLQQVSNALDQGTSRTQCEARALMNSYEQHNEITPTYHETNRFTRAFQAIIDAYGIATYREVNPAPFAIVSFPSLFSVMFGDAGHGALLLLFAIPLIIFEKKIEKKRALNEIVRMFFAGRYIVLMMGIFSVYAGFMYNNFFSKPVNIFGSSWFPNSGEVVDRDTQKDKALLTMNPNVGYDYSGSPYPFGMDPTWMIATNSITWLNTYKMKMSVIFGVSQMMFGNVLSLFNYVLFRDYVSIFCQFIPQVLFLGCLFGYLAVLIIGKWIVFTAKESSYAPPLLLVLMSMFLGGGDAKDSILVFYPHQMRVQKAFVAIIIICIVWILLPKPFILYALHKRKQAQIKSGEESISQSQGHSGGHGKHEFSFGDVFIHQAIHMIEYCLGCISHTASYLRLWALSLAHEQLSDVLWKFLMHIPLTGMSASTTDVGHLFILIFCGFAAWAVLTVAILLVMEGLSAFLHTLRLHWVEFQSKFYESTGIQFKPFSLHSIVVDGNDDN